MKIKYAGPRPIISQHGIFYKNGKEDKYNYLMTALELLHAIDHNYKDRKFYSTYISRKQLKEKQFHTILQRYDADLETEVEQEVQRYEKQIEDELKHIQTLKNISQIEKDVWCENIKLMSSYRIQRAINKIYYFHTIDDIKKIIKKQHIKEIDTPFTEHFWHVLQTVQGALESGKNSVHTELKEETFKNSMIMKLYIRH